VLVGVDADLAEEDAVGPRDRLLAQVHGLAAGVAVREHSQPLLHDRRAAARARLDREVAEPELRELRGQVLGHPADLHLGLARRADHDTRRPARSAFR
jgi:hypothetical protein